MKIANCKRKKRIRCTNGHLLTLDDQQIVLLKAIAKKTAKDLVVC